ncbi:MAG: hypothetical protein HY243_01165 [Proteobacteria bacterium]|nr:hypothetical protein [Pseudomonadota bacterium]
MQALETLKSKGLPVGNSPWDFFGLETENDVLALGDVLSGFHDRDGVSPCFVANFILANADLQRMRNEGFRTLRWIAIKDGFPHPWKDHLVHVYRRNIERKVFFPALHGFTHFNPVQFVASLSERSPRGDLIRKLVEQDIPYLASLTSEYNFALVSRVGGETFLSETDQWDWLSKGADLFAETFGGIPQSTCAPGYRANDTTMRLWRKLGIKVAQSVGTGALMDEEGLLTLQRNVFFEPVLLGFDLVTAALDQAMRAAERGFPIVVCSHSINYLTRFSGRASESRLLLGTFVKALLNLYPNLRFATDIDLYDAYEGCTPGWLRQPRPHEIYNRLTSYVQ